MTQLSDDEVLKQILDKEPRKKNIIKEPREEKTSSNYEFINKPREEKHHQTMKIHQTKDPKKKILRLELRRYCLRRSWVREIWVRWFWYLKNNRPKEEQEKWSNDEEQRNDLTTNRDEEQRKNRRDLSSTHEAILRCFSQQHWRRDQGAARIGDLSAMFLTAVVVNPLSTNLTLNTIKNAGSELRGTQGRRS